MRPTTGAIGTLTTAAQRRLARLDDLARSLGPTVSVADRRLISYVVIEAANLWAEYARCLYLSCALGGRDAAGTRVVPSAATTMDEALTVSIHAIKPSWRGTTRRWNQRDLPTFHNKGELTKTIGYIQATVYPDVDRAVSYQSRVLADLAPMRNYFAHKSERAAKTARNLAPRYGLAATHRPEELLCSVPSSGGDIILREWLADLAAIFGLMP